MSSFEKVCLGCFNLDLENTQTVMFCNNASSTCV